MFTSHPSPAEEELVARASTTRSCAATGNPAPLLTWEQDGMEVSGGEIFHAILTQMVDEFSAASTLRIGPSENDSAGVYQCRARGLTPDGNTSLVYSNSSEIVFTCKDLLIV